MKGSLPHWINKDTVVLLIVAFFVLRLLWSLGKLVFLQFKSHRSGAIPEDLGDKERQILQRLNERLSPRISARTNKLAILGFVLGVGGGIWFYLAPGGTSPSTIGAFLILAIGVAMFLASLVFERREKAQVRFSSVLQPGSVWRLAGIDELQEELQGEYGGLPVQIRFQHAQYDDKGDKEICPARTIVLFSLPITTTLRLALRRDAPWWGTDIKDLLARLPHIESVSVDQLKLFGSPPDQAERVIAQWLQQGFDRWRRTVQERLELSLALVRLDGKTIELHFEGLLTEPLLVDESPSLKNQIEELLGGCLPWCSVSPT